jgi:hypothetical protein
MLKKQNQVIEYLIFQTSIKLRIYLLIPTILILEWLITTMKPSVFSSTRKDSENVSKRWEGNNQFFLNFYVGDSLVDGDVMRYESLMGEGNSKFHESNAAFNRERTKVYFTRNNFYESKKSLSSDRKMKLAIYIADVGAGRQMV